MPWLHRYLGNPVLSLPRPPVLPTPVGDFHCGLRGFRATRSSRSACAPPAWSSPARWSSRPARRPAHQRGADDACARTAARRPPHLRTWRDGWRHLRFLLLVQPALALPLPGVVLLVVGLVGMAALAFGPRSVGGIGLDVQSLLAFATMTILGVQSLGLAVVSRSYAAHLGLLPRSRRIEQVLARFTLEHGAVAGGGPGAGRSGVLRRCGARVGIDRVRAARRVSSIRIPSSGWC